MRIKGKSAAVQKFEAGQEAEKRRKLREDLNESTLGHRFAMLTEFEDVAGRTWTILNYLGIATKGKYQGQRVYYLTCREDLGGAEAFLFRHRSERELIACRTDPYLLLSGIEASEYRRVNHIYE